LKILSIITITYNAAAVLERTLQSIAQQSYQDFEYWVIDGASDDGTLALLEKFPALQAEVISEKDRGIYDAMNKGLTHATGEYVWFMNAGDEIFEKTTVEQLVQQLTQHKADVYFSDTQVVREDGSVAGLRTEVTPHQLPEPLTWQAFRYGMLVCHQSFVVRRSLAPTYLLNHLYSADIDWEIRCLKAAREVKRAPFVLSKYLMGGFSVKNLRRSWADRFWVLQHHFGWPSAVWSHVVIGFRGLFFAFKKRGKYW
jgi:glycosyltransferase involved in cell wall biosynthesis